MTELNVVSIVTAFQLFEIYLQTFNNLALQTLLMFTWMYNCFLTAQVISVL